MRTVSLFSGCGLLDLGLERAGFEITHHSELDKTACQVLARHWPDVPNLGDVREIDWSAIDADAVAITSLRSDDGSPCSDQHPALWTSEDD